MTQDAFLRTFRPDRPGIRKILGDLEAEIMEYMWSRPVEQSVPVREVYEALWFTSSKSVGELPSL